MDKEKLELVAKVPQVTFLFWIIKILATTLGETGGDAVTMSWLGETTAEAKGTGYLIGTGIFGVIFIIAVLVQIRAKNFHPFLYWLTIVATTTVGTTLADYCTRSLGIGYTGGSTILLICVIASLLIWRWSTGSISIETVNTPKVEVFYWVTIMFSQTLGTALGVVQAAHHAGRAFGAKRQRAVVAIVEGGEQVVGVHRYLEPAFETTRRYESSATRGQRITSICALPVAALPLLSSACALVFIPTSTRPSRR